jgi:hypothetical protein
MSGRCNFETLCLGERNRRRLTAAGQYCSLGQIKIRPSPPRSFMAIEDIVPTFDCHPLPRVASEVAAASAAARGVRVSVVRLPQVHDRDKQGLVTFMIALARRKVSRRLSMTGSSAGPRCIGLMPLISAGSCLRLASETGLRTICRVTCARTVRPPRRQPVHLDRHHCDDGEHHPRRDDGPDGRHRICRCRQGWRAPLRRTRSVAPHAAAR